MGPGNQADLATNNVEGASTNAVGVPSSMHGRAPAASAPTVPRSGATYLGGVLFVYLWDFRQESFVRSSSLGPSCEKSCICMGFAIGVFLWGPSKRFFGLAWCLVL